MVSKGQLISKAIYGLLTFPKKRTDEFVLFAFLLFTANKSNSFVHFLGESTVRQSVFWNYLTFSRRAGRVSIQLSLEAGLRIFLTPRMWGLEQRTEKEINNYCQRPWNQNLIEDSD